jgi:hypothetical protein
MTNRNLELTASRATMLKRQKGVEQLLCFRCGQVIQVGQRIHVTSNKKAYHESCWDSLFIDDET